MRNWVPDTDFPQGWIVTPDVYNSYMPDFVARGVSLMKELESDVPDVKKRLAQVRQTLFRGAYASDKEAAAAIRWVYTTVVNPNPSPRG